MDSKSHLFIQPIPGCNTKRLQPKRGGQEMHRRCLIMAATAHSSLQSFFLKSRTEKNILQSNSKKIPIPMHRKSNFGIKHFNSDKAIWQMCRTTFFLGFSEQKTPWKGKLGMQIWSNLKEMLASVQQWGLCDFIGWLGCVFYITWLRDNVRDAALHRCLFLSHPPHRPTLLPPCLSPLTLGHYHLRIQARNRSSAGGETDQLLTAPPKQGRLSVSRSRERHGAGSCP